MEIRLLQKQELHLLQAFLHEYWKPNHILSVNKKLMDFQHFNGYSYNFVVAIENGEILAALGFIPTFQYDHEIEYTDIWLAIWKKSDKPMPKGTGTKLLDWLEETFRPRTIGAIGINDEIEKLYLSRGWVSGVMNHYYFQRIPFLMRIEPDNCFIETRTVNSKFNTYPEKSLTYIENRYLNHISYDYKIYRLQNWYIVTRKITVGKYSVLRIVDMFGSLPEHNIAYALNQLLEYRQCDYMDCLQYGIDPIRFTNIGFSIRPEWLIIPDWFEPYTPEYKPLKFAYKAPTVTRVCGGDCFPVDNYYIYKADSDQDRPNQ